MMTTVLIVLMLLGLVLVPCVIGHYIRASLNTIGPRPTPESLTRR